MTKDFFCLNCGELSTYEIEPNTMYLCSNCDSKIELVPWDEIL